MTTSFNERVRKFPIVSTVAMVSPLALAAGTGAASVGTAAAPLFGASVAISAALDLTDKKRSKLSKVFSAAAIGAGAILPLVITASVSGPDALGLLMIYPYTTALAGAFNLVAHATRNKHLSASVTITDSTPKDPPPAP
jgi:hypothetical protein